MEKTAKLMEKKNTSKKISQLKHDIDLDDDINSFISNNKIYQMI